MRHAHTLLLCCCTPSNWYSRLDYIRLITGITEDQWKPCFISVGNACLPSCLNRLPDFRACTMHCTAATAACCSITRLNDVVAAMVTVRLAATGCWWLERHTDREMERDTDFKVAARDKCIKMSHIIDSELRSNIGLNFVNKPNNCIIAILLIFHRAVHVVAICIPSRREHSTQLTALHCTALSDHHLPTTLNLTFLRP